MAASVIFAHGCRGTVKKLIKQLVVGRRFILSSAYECQDVWEKRLHASLLQSIDMNEYFVQLEKKFNSKLCISGIDIDIFANNIRDKDQLEELEHFIYRFRRSRDTVKLFDSTVHAVIRSFLHYEDYESILRILQDPINYGIFPDYYCYNLLMNNFLKQKNYRDATKIAILMMLQEDFNHPISKRLALYSCHMYLKEPLPGPYLLEETVEKEEKKDEEEEDVFIRVPYIINPFFDDHFDLKEPKLLIGKTLYLLGKEIQGILGQAYQLIGLAMYGKWDKISKLLDEFSSRKEKPVILKTAIEKCKELINESFNGEDEKLKEKWAEELKPKLSKLEESGAVSEGDLHELVMKMLGEVAQFEEADIASQRELYKTWEENRQKVLDEQIQQYLCEEKLKLIESKKKELKDKEQLLFFFEKWNKIEMELEEVKKLEEAVKKDEEEYIPPEVRQGPA